MLSTPRLPAEWEQQDGILIAWPHAQTDWADILDSAAGVYLELARAITRFERVVIVTPEPDHVRTLLTSQNVDLSRITLVALQTNDTWCRDFGPITVYTDNHPLLLDFGFNGWGLKFPANHDNLVTRSLVEREVLKAAVRTPGLVLEGGSIESDGQGTILTTSECLLESNRNPHLSRSELEEVLYELIGAEHILWLDHGFLAGDDTDSHIDTLARLAPDNTIVYVQCDDPTDEHYAALTAMEAQLKTLRTRNDEPYRLVPLPWPKAAYDQEGNRLPATYANFLIINGAVLMPTYDDAADELAATRLAEAFPDREIIGIDCSPLIQQHGSLHCVTMQLPKGVLA